MTAATTTARRQPATLPRNDLRHAYDGPLTPSEPALSEAACDELLRPLYIGGHLQAANDGAERVGQLTTLLLVRRPGKTATALGTGSTIAAAKRQAAERVRVFGAKRILECW